MVRTSARIALLFACAFSLITSSVQAHDPVEEMATAANRFLKSLDKEQTAAAHFKWDDDKREGWYFVPDKFIKPAGKRYGLPLTKMNGAQRALATGLLSSALSHKGFMQAQTVMSLEQILHELENENPIRNPALYYVSIFGEPSAKGTWSWRYEGHHLSINITIVKGKLLSVTPSFFGSNPATVKEGTLKGLQTLADEENLARELVKSLSAEQKKKAILAAEAPADIFTGQDRKVDKGLFTPTKGISQDELNADQKKLLDQMIKTYALKYRLEIVEQMKERKNLFSAKDVRFAWMGGTEPGQGHYYRVQTPIFLFEYDCTQNDANHVHAVWRDFDGDFGADLLRMHYEQDHKK
ncbi:MAG: DUF3500 domain-containing protein [Planctomycetaceae bacterium]|nr:DUF3500 domain-containing protein [Planctomycetaceae bacterium]